MHKLCSRPFVRYLLNGKIIASAPGRASSSALVDKLVDEPTVRVLDPLDQDDNVKLDLFRPRMDLPHHIKNLQMSGQHKLLPNPFKLVEEEISSLSDSIKELLAIKNPVLEAAAKYFFEVDGGKKMRPVMVLLVSKAANVHALQAGYHPPPNITPFTLDSQRRLAEISEMIHTASLFHDDVIDKADTRRGVPSANKAFGNKLSILAGDFLLARASICLARLRSVGAVEVMSKVIEQLVQGEILQLQQRNQLAEAVLATPDTGGQGMSPQEDALQQYLMKNYFKTGSLMSNSCKAATLVAGHTEAVQEVAFEYGMRLGLAFQLVDDVLDYEGSWAGLGKPPLADLSAGLATAPLILAATTPAEWEVVRRLTARRFGEDGDIEQALELVKRGGGIEQTKELARLQADLAIKAINSLCPSAEQDALVHLAYKIVNRDR